MKNNSNDINILEQQISNNEDICCSCGNIESHLPYQQHRQEHQGNIRLSQLPQRLCLWHFLQEASGHVASELSQ